MDYETAKYAQHLIGKNELELAFCILFQSGHKSVIDWNITYICQFKKGPIDTNKLHDFLREMVSALESEWPTVIETTTIRDQLAINCPVYTKELWDKTPGHIDFSTWPYYYADQVLKHRNKS